MVGCASDVGLAMTSIKTEGQHPSMHIPLYPKLLPNYFKNDSVGQAVLQGVPFTGVQVLRWKGLILLHEKKG